MEQFLCWRRSHWTWTKIVQHGTRLGDSNWSSTLQLQRKFSKSPLAYLKGNALFEPEAGRRMETFGASFRKGSLRKHLSKSKYWHFAVQLSLDRLIKWFSCTNGLGGMFCLACLTTNMRDEKWIVNCPHTVSMVYILKIFGRGLSLERTFRGWERDTNRKQPAKRSPCKNTIWKILKNAFREKNSHAFHFRTICNTNYHLSAFKNY